MSARRTLGFLSALALLAPLAAVAAVPCAPGPHCPMAGLAGEPPPCHGAAIQEDDCCVTAAGVEPAPVLPVVAGGALVIDDGVTVARPMLLSQVRPGPDGAPSAPLYRLYRTLLI